MSASFSPPNIPTILGQGPSESSIGADQKGRLAQLVSKFEFLNVVSNFEKMARSEQSIATPLPQRMPAITDADASPQSSMKQTWVQPLSISSNAASFLPASSIVASPGRCFESPVPKKTHNSIKSPATRRKSVVEERRLFFEGRLPTATAVTHSHQTSHKLESMVDTHSGQFTRHSPPGVVTLKNAASRLGVHGTPLQTIARKNARQRLPAAQTCPSLHYAPQHRGQATQTASKGDTLTRPSPCSLSTPKPQMSPREIYLWPPTPYRMVKRPKSPYPPPCDLQFAAMPLCDPLRSHPPEHAGCSPKVKPLAQIELREHQRLWSTPSSALALNLPARARGFDQTDDSNREGPFNRPLSTFKQKQALSKGHICRNNHVDGKRSQNHALIEEATDLGADKSVSPKLKASASRFAPQSPDSPRHHKSTRMQDKIRVYELLSRRRGTTAASSHGHSPLTDKEKSCASTNDTISSSPTAIGLGTTFRRISESLNPARLVNVMRRRRDLFGTFIGDQSRLREGFAFVPLDKQKDIRAVSCVSQPNTSTATGRSIDGSDLQKLDDSSAKHRAGQREVQGKVSGLVFRGKNAAASRISQPQKHNGQLERFKCNFGQQATTESNPCDGDWGPTSCNRWQSTRRRLSQSSGTLVAQAHCALSHPQPVRRNGADRLERMYGDAATTG